MLFTHLVGIQISFICGAINLEADVRRLTRRFPKSVEAEAVQKSSFTLGLFFLPLHQHNYITITAKLRECTRNSNDGIESTVYTLNPFGHKTRSKCLQRKKERVICLFSYFYSIDRSAEHIAIFVHQKRCWKRRSFRLVHIYDRVSYQVVGWWGTRYPSTLFQVSSNSISWCGGEMEWKEDTHTIAQQQKEEKTTCRHWLNQMKASPVPIVNSPISSVAGNILEDQQCF